MAGPGIKPKLKWPFGRKNRDVLGFEIDENHLKIVHLQQKGLRREFSHAAVLSIHGLFGDGILYIIRQTIEQFQVVNPRVFLIVSLPLVITRSIEIPSQDPDEIREIVNLQASRHTPYARAEIIVDMMNLGMVRERYSKILLVIVPKESVNKNTQLIDKAGLNLEKVIFPPEAVAIVANKMMGRDADEGAYGVLHMDYAFTSFIVVESGKILFVRGIHIGANHLIEERASYIDRFQDELEKSLETYATDEVGSLPKTVLLTGVLQEISDFDDLLADTLKVKTKRVPYLDYFHLSDAAKNAMASSKMVSFLNLLAPIAMFDKMRVDLTSEEKRLKIQLEKRARQMMLTGVLTMVFLSLIFADVTAKISYRKAYLKQITTHYLPVRESAKQLEGMLAKIDLIKSYLVSRGNSLKALTELYDATPPDIWLNEIKYDESSQKFSLKGTSSVMSSVFAFVADLDKSSMFKNVKTKYVNSRQEDGRDVADFEINCLVEAVPTQ
jgi:Tfp pilus assembly PilM family ATPase/Tfp pilus assembly protein PilN